MNAAVFFATREGQAQRVAERVAASLRTRRMSVTLVDVAKVREPLDWSRYETAFVVASVHVGRHEKEMIAFARRHRLQLQQLEAAFLSLSLSQAGAEDVSALPGQRAAAAADAARMIDGFVAETGWRPVRTLPVAGALLYSKYNFLVKIIMKRIARAAGFHGDTSHDYEFTNWRAVDEFVDQTGRAA